MVQDDPRVGLVLDNRYQIEERLASGGMGVVYRAIRIGLDKPVAIKFLHHTAAANNESTERFRREVAVMSRLSHPNLMTIIDFGEHQGSPYLVMEFYEGGVLQDLITGVALEPKRAVFITRQILAGLASAHERDVVHRDLKPANVLLVGSRGEDFVKVFDFGVAKLLDDGAGPSEASVAARTVLGTPEYMAPEQIRKEPVDARTDLYAVGVMLYEMIVGKRPFEAGNDLAVLRAQLEDAPVPPSAIRGGISRELNDAIMRGLEKASETRWQSATEFAEALSKLPEGSRELSLRGAAPKSENAETTEQLPRRPRWRWLLPVLLLCVFGTVGYGAFYAAREGIIDQPWLHPGPLKEVRRPRSRPAAVDLSPTADEIAAPTGAPLHNAEPGNADLGVRDAGLEDANDGDAGVGDAGLGDAGLENANDGDMGPGDAGGPGQ